MYINFLRYRKVYYLFSGILIGASIFSLAVFGINFGIDFTGGSILELDYKDQRPSNQEVADILAGFDLGTVYLQPTGEKGLLIRMKDIDEQTHSQIMEELNRGRDVEEKRFESVGPVIGRELKRKTITLIAAALISIVAYVAFAFRRVRRPVSSFRYGIATLIALFHDVLIPLGVISVMGKLYGLQMTIPIITALLAVQGYSVNDTVIVFDRIRENLLKGEGSSFEETVNISLNQTIARSLSTSITTLLVVLAIFFLGGQTLQGFALTLIVGIASGAYSSIFIASPLLVSWKS